MQCTVGRCLLSLRPAAYKLWLFSFDVQIYEFIIIRKTLFTPYYWKVTWKRLCVCVVARSHLETGQSPRIQPHTYRDYLCKYYGSDARLPADDNDIDDASYFSDGCVDYDDNKRSVVFHLNRLLDAWVPVCFTLFIWTFSLAQCRPVSSVGWSAESRLLITPRRPRGPDVWEERIQFPADRLSWIS